MTTGINAIQYFPPSDFEPKLVRDHIVRSLYADSLQALKERKVIILQAAPGFGKQSLLAYIHQKSHGKKIWLTLTAKDNNKSIFIEKLTKSLALSQIQLSEYEALNLQRSSADDIAYIIAKAISDKGKVTFFFAGIHHLKQSFIKTLLAALLHTTGHQVRFLMSCNHNHSLNIASLAIDNQVHYINNPSLRFSANEALTVINKDRKG